VCATGAVQRREAKRSKSNRPKTKLGLPDLEHAKSAVLVSLRSPESQRSYRRSIDDFVCWYCSEPRLSFNKTVVTRYRIHLEDRLLAPGTINVRLAAVRRLAYEAADTGLLSPDLAAGIRRVKGAKKLGMRLGNWLTVTEARSLWQLPNAHTLIDVMIPDHVMNVVFVVVASVLFLGILLVAIGTVTKNGWGINLEPVNCPTCGSPTPQVRRPKSLRQSLWGGWTCGKCGCEMDKWGRPITRAR